MLTVQWKDLPCDRIFVLLFVVEALCLFSSRFLNFVSFILYFSDNYFKIILYCFDGSLLSTEENQKLLTTHIMSAAANSSTEN
jgi:hypothetical protein